MGKNTALETNKQKEMMINALETNCGNVSMAAKAAGISVRTHYRWRKEDNDYDTKANCLKDICYRTIKEKLISTGLKMAEKGNAQVLNKMLGIFLKDIHEEMKILNRANDAPVIAKIRYVDTPPGWEEEIREMEERARRRDG